VTLACTRQNEEEQRARRHAAQQLGVLSAATRVTTRSELGTDRHRFLRVSVAGESGPELTVVVPRQGGGIFDSQTPGAFDRVARAEDTAHRSQQLGADRIAAWFGALGGGLCRDPLHTTERNATLHATDDGGIRVSYRFVTMPEGTEAAHVRECVVHLAPDGSLRGANVESTAEGSSPQGARDTQKKS
jgi:hypothetical protein